MKILVGYDGSEPAKKALEMTKQHAQAFGAEMTYVLNCLEGFPREQVQHMEEGKKHLAEAEDLLKGEGISCTTELVTKELSAGEGLVTFAEENGVDEIILGVVQKSKVGKLLFGSTAQYVILNAPCPVLSVK